MTQPGYRDRLKSAIVRTSREILARDGLDGLQARKVASASDCSVGTIYNLFGSLDMVIIAANAETLAELLERMASSKLDSGALADKLDALAMAYLAFAIERNNEWRAVFEHRLPARVQVPDWYKQGQGEIFALVAENLQPALVTSEERLEAAHTLFAAVHGVITLALDPKLGEFDETTATRRVQFITKALAEGIDKGNSQ